MLTDYMRRVSRGTERAPLVLKNGYVLNVYSDELIQTDVAVADGLIVGVGDYEGELEVDCTGRYVLPGFIDAHMHVESTLVTPLELARCVIPCGTTTVIADPHELVNVRGAEALDYFLDSCERSALSIFTMVPSCVPATPFDTNGAGAFTARDMRRFASDPRVLGLAEMMNYNEVLSADGETLDKLSLFAGRPIDGHSPGLVGRDIELYRLNGILTDHECSSFDEALLKLRAGIHILIRDGSGAHDLDGIIEGLLRLSLPFDCCSLCTDDMHVDDIAERGHINYCVNRATALGVPPVYAIEMATINTARLYGLRDLGAVSAGMRADMIVCDDLMDIKPWAVFKDGALFDPRARDTEDLPAPPSLLHTVLFSPLTPERIALKVRDRNHVIGLLRDRIATEHLIRSLPADADGRFLPNAEYNKLVTVERHGRSGNAAVCALAGLGITNGAIASTVSHDSHNLIAAGDNDADIIAACERLRATGGGYVVISRGEVAAELALPICGLMTDESADTVEAKTRRITLAARALGAGCSDPMSCLSFAALPVIPSLRLLDTGLFDVDNYCFIKD